jgi:hypothetical protein
MMWPEGGKMGFSKWYHLDFSDIIDESDKHLYVKAETGVVYMVNKKCVADRKDYKKGDKNGTISIDERHAERLGLV